MRKVECWQCRKKCSVFSTSRLEEHSGFMQSFKVMSKSVFVELTQSQARRNRVKNLRIKHVIN